MIKDFPELEMVVSALKMQLPGPFSKCSSGSSVYKELLKLYVDGFYKEHLVSLTKRNGRIARNQSDDD
jgi:hypothetical protein